VPSVSDNSLIPGSWFFSSELSAKAIGNHSVYDPSKSKTSSKVDGASWNITYGDNSAASGDVYFDTVSVGGAVVKKQAIELASNVSDQFVTDYASGGLLGLGFDSINTGTLGGIPFRHPALHHKTYSNTQGSIPETPEDLLHQCQTIIS